jgi:uncharacterized RDD family membrane protein YckC
MALPYNPYAPPEAPPHFPGDPTAILLATRSQRFAGALVDSLFGISLGFLPAAAFHAAGLDPFPAELTQAAGMSWLPSGLLALFLGFIPTSIQWWLISRSGQTLGKKVAHTRIVTLDGEVAGFVSGVLLRWMPILAASTLSVVLATFAPSAGLLKHLLTMLLGVDVLFIFGPSRRCLHDHIASTRVVRVSD